MISTANWSIIHVIENARGMVGFTPWSLEANTHGPCLYHRAKVEPPTGEKEHDSKVRASFGTVFISLKTFCAVRFETNSMYSGRDLNWHPKRHMLLTTQRVRSCDPQATAVAWQVEHDRDVKQLLLSPDMRHLAIVAKTSSGPRLLVLDVATNTCIYHMKDFARCSANWASSTILRCNMGFDETRVVVFDASELRPPKVLPMLYQRNPKGPWGNSKPVCTIHHN